MVILAAVPRLLLNVTNDAELEMYVEYFATVGWDVVVVRSSTELVSTLKDLQVDAAVVDAWFRWGTAFGSDVVRVLRKNDSTQLVPIVAITSPPTMSLIEELEAVGCDECLAKPVLPDVLAATITRLIELQAR